MVSSCFHPRATAVNSSASPSRLGRNPAIALPGIASGTPTIAKTPTVTRNTAHAGHRKAAPATAMRVPSRMAAIARMTKASDR